MPNDKRIGKLEVSVGKAVTEIENVKETLRDQISPTINKIWDKVGGEICPQVKDNSFWVGKIKFGVCWIAVIAVGGGIVSLLFYFVRQGAAH